MNNREMRTRFQSLLMARIKRTAEASASAMQMVPIAVSLCLRQDEERPFPASIFSG
jgi:hypothetical protein